QILYDLVREELINRYPLISVGWLNHDTPLIEWTQPNAEQAAKNLIQIGAKAIVYMPIGFATENHETLLDVHHIIHNIEKKYKNVNCIQMDCVNDHHEFMIMAAEWADSHIEELLAEEATAINPSQAVAHHHHHH
ncbi:MAG: ferrochelatase, partial [Cyanobacteria bacterium J06629_18]